MTVDHLDPTPLYQQLANILRARITVASGRGEPLPSESYLQQEHGVSRVTVRKAVQVLRDEGLVITIPQRGTYIAG